MSRPLPAEIGEHLGGYRLERVIAHGGMGCVYVGRHLVLGRPAAIKVLDRSLAVNDEYMERFLREARIVNDVRHPNIVDIFDFVRTEEPRRVACVMEFLEGPTIEAVVEEAPLTPTQALNVTHQLVGALEKVHSQGVIHRDLKPSNVVVIGDLGSPLATVPSVKVLDFGIAKVFTSNAEHTGPGTMLGTPAYMAPEQVSGEQISAATDVYALGELLFEMLTGKRAFEGNARQVLKLKMIGQPPEIAFARDVPEHARLARIITRSLDADPTGRPSLEEFASTLHEVRLALPDPTTAAAPLRGSNSSADPSLEKAVTTPVDAVDPKELVDATPVHQASADGDVRRLGDYALFITLPPRGMTQSYIARRAGSVEICVLRRLLRQLEENETATARFRREAKITRHLRHPRIATMMDARIIEGTFCIASELVLGVSLETLIDRLRRSKSPMPLQVFGRIALATLDALHYAHEATDDHGRPLGIVHRDLNPSSVALSFSGSVKLQGFGVARASVDDFRTAPGTAVGSLEYMSPEQVRSEVVDRRSDIYTISTVFFEMLAGRKLIEPKGVLETLRSVATDVPPPLTSLRPDIPVSLAQAIENGLAKRAEERFATAAEMSAVIADTLGGFAAASRDVVGDFVRHIMPDEEQNTLEMLSHVRALGERVARDEPEPTPHEPTMTVRRRTLPREFVPVDPTDAAEPDLLTMPGAPAPLETQNRPIVLPAPRPSRDKQKNWARIAVFAALLITVFTVTSAIVSRLGSAPDPIVETRSPGVEARPAPPPAAQITQRATPPPPPAVAKKQRPATTRGPPPAPPTKPTKRATRSRPVVAPPPPPPPRPRARTRHAALTRQLTRLRGDASNVELFDSLAASIWREAKKLPNTERRRVKIKLDAAQRTYAVEDLAAALARLDLAAAKAP